MAIFGRGLDDLGVSALLDGGLAVGFAGSRFVVVVLVPQPTAVASARTVIHLNGVDTGKCRFMFLT